MELYYSITPALQYSLLGSFIGAKCPNCYNIYHLGKTMKEAKERCPYIWHCYNCRTVSYISFTPKENASHNEYGEIHP